MKKHIIEILHQIEKEYEVRILFACEAGSRAWGFPSETSDYDIRFIYVHKPEWYLSIDKKRDVIEVPKHEKLCIPVHHLIDMSGWEITKALRLLRKSNPSLLEWLHSNNVYYQIDSITEKVLELSAKTFAPVPCMHHYIRMAKANYKRLRETVPSIKGYVNVIRPLFAAKWIEENNEMAPLELPVIVGKVEMNEDVKLEVTELLHKKISGQDLKDVNLNHLDSHINSELKRLEEYVETLPIKINDPTDLLDSFFRETLTSIWN
ncbi:DNA polymerase beta superfamily protein [Fredinandcohnia humi]